MVVSLKQGKVEDRSSMGQVFVCCRYKTGSTIIYIGRFSIASRISRKYLETICVVLLYKEKEIIVNSPIHNILLFLLSPFC